MAIKILVDAHKFDHSFQGSATYIEGLYNALVQYNDLKITLCSSDIAKLKQIFPDKRFSFISLNSSSAVKRLAIEFPKIIKKGGFDFAHFQYIVPLTKSCKFINTIHDLLFLDFKEYFPWSYRVVRNLLFKYSAIRSDIILTVSEYSKQKIIKKFRVKPNNIFVTPNGVSRQLKGIIKEKNNFGLSNYILYVSRFEPRKNHVGLLQAYLSLKLDKQGYDLLFVGTKKDAVEVAAFNQLIEMIPPEVKHKIKFFEGLDWEQLNCLYRNAACFVFPSFAEGFGIPPIEAAINNCKVLCSNRTAMRDFSFFNYSFNPYDMEEFKIKLTNILKDQNYPFDEIKNKIINKYDWDKVAKTYYDELINNHAKSK